MNDADTGCRRYVDRTALVTGSTRGIGASIAERLAAEGASIVITGRSEADGAQVARELRERGTAVHFVRADLREPDEIRNLIDRTAKELGGIDVLVNNAAVQTETSVTEASLEDWSLVVETDFRAYWLCVKYAVEHMPEGGSIVNVSSNHAYATMPAHFPYNAVKAGIEGMTRAIAVDFGPIGIRANAVTPGWVLVDRTEGSLDDGEREELEEIHPVGRLGRPEDVAGTVAWLGSEDASFVTGASILVDGGRGAVMQDNRMREHRADLSAQPQ